MGTREYKHIKWQDVVDFSEYKDSELPRDFIESCIKLYGGVDKIPFGDNSESPPVFTARSLIEYELGKIENTLVGQELFLQLHELKQKGKFLKIYSGGKSEADKLGIYISLYSSTNPLYEDIGHEIAHFIELNTLNSNGVNFSNTPIVSANFLDLKEYLFTNKDKPQFKNIIDSSEKKFEELNKEIWEELNKNFKETMNNGGREKFLKAMSDAGLVLNQEITSAINNTELDLTKFQKACEEYAMKILNDSDLANFRKIAKSTADNWFNTEAIIAINKKYILESLKYDNELYNELGEVDTKFRDAYFAITKSFNPEIMDSGFNPFLEDYGMDIEALLGVDRPPRRLSYSDLTKKKLENDEKKIVFSDNPYPENFGSKPAYVFDLMRGINKTWEDIFNTVPNPDVQNGILNKDIELKFSLLEFQRIFADKILENSELEKIKEIQKTLLNFGITTKIDLENNEVRVVNYFRAEGFTTSKDIEKN